MVHGRWADGRGVDWMLHADPARDTCGMLVAFNPLPEPVSVELSVNLYYTGPTDRAVATFADGTAMSRRRKLTHVMPPGSMRNGTSDV